ncbi:hypothetical protein CEXT_384231 [Caerostris extrusa]|uniref:Uncharacterized protein n=1 Tax=Caerostris extrusa TaxID=172846 RepID=A0AAV4QN64_CAEEX|nr:hypothetical protein CEXT_384231 [Caerostris extrusa]
MSTFRVIYHFKPTCGQGQSIKNLMTVQDIDTPARTEWSLNEDRNTHHFIITETTFCKEKVHPPNTDLDSFLAAECNAIPGLVNLESNFQLSKESTDLKNEKSLSKPIIKVAPMNDDSRGEILISVPLKVIFKTFQVPPVCVLHMQT